MAAQRGDSLVARRAKYLARGLANRLRDFAEEEPRGFDLDAVGEADIALYFADAPTKLYQLAQWLPIFEQHPESRTIVVVRHIETYDRLLPLTSLPVVLAPNYDELMALYDRASFHAVVYVNNGWTNFQSLAFQQAVHIHVNHGESDKICMVSNQAKAYDHVFVAGEAALRRHEAAIALFDLDKLVRVGRPQLDLPVASPLPDFDGPTIVYAPTWEGEDDANNYTSIDVLGIAIIEAALAQTGARVVYKPHPRVAGSRDAGVRAAHEGIIERMTAAGQPVLLDADVLGVIRASDLLIGDVSSVTLDHLYLRPDSPIVLTDRRADRARLTADTPLARATHIVDTSTVGTLQADLADQLAHDPNRQERRALRDYYFDGLAPGESTTRFWARLDEAVEAHDAALATLSRMRPTTPVPTREGAS